MTEYVFSQYGYPIGVLDQRPYWAVKLNTGKWLCEMDQVDARIDKIVTQASTMPGLYEGIGLHPGKRYLDWTLDICGPSGDWKKIEELWMICPSTPTSPGGNTVRLPITPPGTAFQLKVGFADSGLTTTIRRTEAQIVGRVVDEETGACEAFVFDYSIPGLVGPWKSNVNDMGTWRPNIPGMPSIAPLGKLSFDVLGLHFGDRAGV